ncbi:MAG: hypothetical protein DDG60_06020 [Anaerolineae bacterium]|nr:MAG: hypothetical protein DDG60_06020 [Anaerolineae bacterium]
MKKIKIEFEWWWLWIPVVIFSFFKMMDFNKSSLFLSGLYMSLFLLASLGIGFRPRKPTVIYSHLNTMLRHLYWIVSGAALVLLWSAFGETASGLDIPGWLAFVLFLGVMALMGLSVVYFLYWSLPYSRKRSGIAAVDAAIERYRKPGERIDWQWIPDMVIEKNRYRAVVYLTGGLNAPLAFDLHGKVIRDEALMNKIVQCVKMAGNIMHPERINWRADAYKNTQKAIRLGHKALRKWSRLFGGLPVEYAGEVEWLRRGLEMWLESAEEMCHYWYLEAEYGMRQKNTQMKEVRYEDVEWLNRQVNLDENRLDKWDQVFRAVRILDNFLVRQHQYYTAERKAIIKVMVDHELTMRDVRRTKERGVVIVPYLGMTADDRMMWRSRLAWVDVVDSWAAQGYTGKALEAKKREYLEEQARLEAERERQEEAEKARQREERAQKRAARKAQRKQ